MSSVIALIVCMYVPAVWSDYTCVCNHNVETAVYSVKSENTQPIGYVYEFDCKAQLGPADGNWVSLAFEHQAGYINNNGQMQVQLCSGNPHVEDLVTTPKSPGSTGAGSKTTTILTTTLSKTNTSPSTTTPHTTTTAVPQPITTEATTSATTRKTMATPQPSTTTTIIPSTTTSMLPSTTTTIPSTTTSMLPSTITAIPSTTTSMLPTTTTTIHSTTTSMLPTATTPIPSITTSMLPSTTTIIPSTTPSMLPSTTTAIPSTTTSMLPTTTTHLSTTTSPTTATTVLPATSSTSTTTMSSSQATTSQETITTPTTKSSITPFQITPGNLVSCKDILRNIAARDNGTLFAYGEKCYELVDIHTTWVNAELECRRRGGHLVHIGGPNEQHVVFQVLSNYYNASVWIGLHDLHHEEQFQWTSGSPVMYTNWYPGRKNAAHHWTEDCVAMASSEYSGHWDDLSCSEKRGYICQFGKDTAMAHPSLIG